MNPGFDAIEFDNLDRVLSLLKFLLSLIAWSICSSVLLGIGEFPSNGEESYHRIKHPKQKT